MKRILALNGFEGYEENPYQNSDSDQNRKIPIEEEKLPIPANDNEKQALQERLEAEIDALVYELYGVKSPVLVGTQEPN